MRVRTLTLAVAILGALSCSKARPVTGGAPVNRVSWQEEIAPLFAANCSSCHSGATASAGYQTTSYLAALGPTAAPVAVAGDANSLLLRTLDPALADAVHAPVSSTYAEARAWVVDGKLSFFRSEVHPGGILNPNDATEFHGVLLRTLKFNLNACAACHGADFAGGTVGVSCLPCHAQGPTACDTCHGQPPATGAHAAHALGAVGHKLDCTDCHIKPLRWDDPGHLTNADGTVKSKGTVTFAAQSEAALPMPGRTGAPAWDGVTCTNVYCHGGTLQDSKATITAPAWNAGSSQAACGTCHGFPPASHDVKYGGDAQCTACHQLTLTAGSGLNTTLHVDGVVEVGDTKGTCSSCHGGAQNAAPPRDLSGNTTPVSLGVGAHQAHLVGAQNLSAPVPCSACHVVPAAVTDPGHVDHPLPATVIFSGLAVVDGAQPVWSHASATCTNSYCHGGGASMAADTAAKLRTPDWTLGTSQAFCGSCHGIPPSTAIHTGVVFPDCNRCHPSTVAPNGGIIVAGPPGARTSTHINGVVDHVP